MPSPAAPKPACLIANNHTSPCAYINFAAALEMTLRNGRMKIYAMILFGLETGDPCNFKTWGRLLEGLLRAADQLPETRVHPTTYHYPFPPQIYFSLALCLVCTTYVLYRKYLQSHSPVIEGGIDMGHSEFIGHGTVIDLLAAVKSLVFETKKLPPLPLALCDFEGKEFVRQLLMHAPSYGNNDPYADAIGKAIDLEVSQSFYIRAELGGTSTFTSHVPFGRGG